VVHPHLFLSWPPHSCCIGCRGAPCKTGRPCTNVLFPAQPTPVSCYLDVLAHGLIVAFLRSFGLLPPLPSSSPRTTLATQRPCPSLYPRFAISSAPFKAAPPARPLLPPPPRPRQSRRAGDCTFRLSTPAARRHPPQRRLRPRAPQPPPFAASAPPSPRCSLQPAPVLPHPLWVRLPPRPLELRPWQQERQ